jgi:hypothetical protein
MRKTEQAQQQFQFCKSRMLGIAPLSEPNETFLEYNFNLAEGLGLCAGAIRDVFDKLAELEKKVDMLVTDAARRSVGLR